MVDTKKVLTGIDYIDNIDNGINPETITLIYGEPETGKSTLTTQCAFNCATQNLKTLYIDCDNTFSSKRLAQIANEKLDNIADKILLIKPINFKEQTTLIDKIDAYITPPHKFGLIVIDTINSLYGAKIAETQNKTIAFSVNRELNRQMAILAQTAKIQKIPIIINSQVRNIFSDPSGSVKPAANRVLTFWADNIISLKPAETKLVKVTIEKYHTKMMHITGYVQIGERGIFATEFYE
ncbi:MAG: AAA family ATPase [Candidatus Bathyarchaeota archaeon]|nr:AAA family ATPase [Candidatus Termiticorpusculum sp.]MCL1970786.1 AAA family ATPase [Candidatus Termiticorpusculum sp.]